MHCDGKCYLQKKLNEDQGQDKQVPSSKKERVEVTPFFVPSPIHINAFAATKTKHAAYHPIFLSSAFLRAVFHPPTV